jgi:hypothetical protein
MSEVGRRKTTLHDDFGFDIRQEWIGGDSYWRIVLGPDGMPAINQDAPRRRGGPRSPKIEPTLRQSTSLPNGSNGTKSGWKSEGFSYGNPAKFAGTERKPAQPVHQPNLFKTISDVQDFCARERGVR